MIKITEPTLILDENKCRRNIRRMVEKAKNNNIRLRPHFKTHQSRKIGRWFREYGVNCITVSSLKMAEYFADDSWNDITVAFPINILEIDRINRLAAKIKLNLLTLNPDVTRKLGHLVKNAVGIFIKIDVGTHRTGLQPDAHTTIRNILAAMEQSPNLHFRGFLAHAGHSYGARSKAGILQVHEESIGVLKKLKQTYLPDYPGLELSTGDSPTCSVARDFKYVDEIRPGNFVFYDLMQVQIGSCTYDQISTALACPVVARHPDRNEILLYGGGIHLSKDFLELGNGKRCYGQLVKFHENGWSEPIEGCYLSKLSQEHGTLVVDASTFSQIQVGEVVGILPVHSCMSGNLMAGYVTLGGEEMDHMNGVRGRGIVGMPDAG